MQYDHSHACRGGRLLITVVFFKQKTAYVVETSLDFRRVLFRSHDFDLARWLMKDEVAEVHAFGGTLACPELVQFGELDAGIVNLRFSRGAIGNVESFRQSRYGYDIYTEVVGSKATLRIGYLRQTALTVLSGAGAGHDVVDHFLVRFAEAYLNEVRDFVRSVLAASAPRVTG